MATIAKVNRPKYFSCNQGPKAHLYAKFIVPRTVNIRDKIMSCVFDCIVLDGRRIPTEVFVPCWRKKNLKKKIQASDFFYYRKHIEDFSYFWTEKLPIWEKNLLSSQHVGGKNKIKL